MSMSNAQNLGIGHRNFQMLAALVVTYFCVVFVALYSAYVMVAMGYYLLAVGVLILEIFVKPYTFSSYWGLRHDQPGNAAVALGFFAFLVAMSSSMTFLRSVFFPELGGTDRVQAIVLLVFQFMASGWLNIWYNETKWIEGKPHDGLPHAYRPGYQPVQLEAQPAPQALPLPETHGVMASIGTAFGHWLEDKLDEDPSGSVEFMAALASYNSWAMPLNYPVADQAIFGSLVMDLVSQTPKISFENGHIIGVRFTEDVDQSFKD